MACGDSYKKYAIQKIVNPAKFFIVEYGKDIQNDQKLYISSKDVKAFKHLEDLSVGQIVAVKYQGRFFRGSIIDIYNRCLKPIYYIWLVDSNCNIEVSADSVFILKTSELRKKKLNAVELVVHGIQPVTIELLVGSLELDENANKNDLCGILHKRESSTWSPAAINFIKDLFKTNKCIYVKCIDNYGLKITGDVYYKQEGVNDLISLAQTLCDKDFAIYSKSALKLLPLYGNQNDRYINSIERRIPSSPQNLDEDNFSDVNCKHRRTGNQFRPGELSSCSGSDNSTYSGSHKFSNSLEEKASSLEICSFSPSWILKKMGQLSEKTPSESFKSMCQNLDQGEKTVQTPKVNLLRIVQRNVELYDKRKVE